MLPWWLRQSGICLWCRRPGFDPWVGKIPWRMERLLTPVFLLGEFHGQRSLAGYSPWGCKESDMTERISLSLQFQVQNKIVRKVPKFPMCSLPPWKHVFPHFNIQPILKLDKLISVTDTKEEFRFSPNPVLVSFSSLCWMLEPPPPISQSRPERWWGT